LRVALARGHEHRDLVGSGGDRALEPPLVRYEDGGPDAGPAAQPLEQLIGVRELRHGGRADERRGFDRGVPRVGQPIEELELRLGRERALLGL